MLGKFLPTFFCGVFTVQALFASAVPNAERCADAATIVATYATDDLHERFVETLRRFGVEEKAIAQIAEAPRGTEDLWSSELKDFVDENKIPVAQVDKVFSTIETRLTEMSPGTFDPDIASRLTKTMLQKMLSPSDEEITERQKFIFDRYENEDFDGPPKLYRRFFHKPEEGNFFQAMAHLKENYGRIPAPRELTIRELELIVAVINYEGNIGKVDVPAMAYRLEVDDSDIEKWKQYPEVLSAFLWDATGKPRERYVGNKGRKLFKQEQLHNYWGHANKMLGIFGSKEVYKKMGWTSLRLDFFNSENQPDPAWHNVDGQRLFINDHFKGKGRAAKAWNWVAGVWGDPTKIGWEKGLIPLIKKEDFIDAAGTPLKRWRNDEGLLAFAEASSVRPYSAWQWYRDRFGDPKQMGWKYYHHSLTANSIRDLREKIRKDPSTFVKTYKSVTGALELAKELGITVSKASTAKLILYPIAKAELEPRQFKALSWDTARATASAAPRTDEFLDKNNQPYSHWLNDEGQFAFAEARGSSPNAVWRWYKRGYGNPAAIGWSVYDSRLSTSTIRSIRQKISDSPQEFVEQYRGLNGLFNLVSELNLKVKDEKDAKNLLSGIVHTALGRDLSIELGWLTKVPSAEKWRSKWGPRKAG